MSTVRQIPPSPPRTPLQDTTNAMGPEPSSPLYHTAKSTQSAKTRRRFSIPFFRPQNLDSSESTPSAHSSLWDAPLAEPPVYTTLGNGNWDASVADITPPPINLKAKKKKRGGKKGMAKPATPPAAIQRTLSAPLDPNVHHPHLLDTITERSSLPTLRSHRPSTLSLQQRTPSISTLRARTSALHKRSFSVADLPTPMPAPSDSASKSSLSSENYAVQALPNTPIHDPPDRMPTPPGLPKFNTPEAINYRLPPPQLGFREKFRRRPTPEEFQYRRQTAHLPPGVVMRGEEGELIRGRWRHGGHSGHTGYGAQGRLENHPFNRAPMADIASEGDDPALGRPENVQNVAIGPAEEPRTEQKKGTRWERLVELTCFVCCGVERGPDGQIVPATVSTRGRDETRDPQQPMMTGAREVEGRRRNRAGRFMRVGGDGWMY
ncbi:MAG: hypothetical protein L6R40_005162 [Gallowayella cf. fulva]|nr:MAG: hypothetical protein L6R40_005162 [Xanthomendoza cf. fulva]